MFKVTKRFIGGLLNGLTIVETYSWAPAVGWVCSKPCGGSPYEIVAVEPAE